jgi:hypothetical protein
MAVPRNLQEVGVSSFTQHDQSLGGLMEGSGKIEWNASYRHAHFDAVHPTLIIYEVAW